VNKVEISEDVLDRLRSPAKKSRYGIHTIVIRTLYTDFVACVNKLLFLYFAGCSLKASKKGELLCSYKEYPAKSVGEQGKEFLIAAQVKS
jgi:hypothetical protein